MNKQMQLPADIQNYIDTQLELICLELNLKDRSKLLCRTNGMRYYFYTCDSKRMLAEFQFIKTRNKLLLIQEVLFKSNIFEPQFVILDNKPFVFNLCNN